MGKTGFPFVILHRKKSSHSIRPQTIRFLDMWLGRPVCAFLTGVRFLAGVLNKSHSPRPQVRKILFIKLTEQGATVLAYDALQRAVELVGKENVYFLVFDCNRDILDLLDVIPARNVLSVRSGKLLLFLWDTARAMLRVRKDGVDSAVDMEFYSRSSAILAYLSGANKRVGLHRFTSEGPYRGNLMTHRIQYNPYMSTASAYRMLVEALFTDPQDLPLIKSLPLSVGEPPQVEISEPERSQMQKKLDSAAGREVRGPIVILNPNAGDMIPLRRWPQERFIELGRRLLRDYSQLNIVVTGSGHERAAALDIAERIDAERTICLAGETSIQELLVLYSLSDVLVTNDSGPGHFASLTSIDAVCLFGPETPALYAPLGKRSRVLWAGLACSPCVNVLNHRFSPCRENLCMQAISVDKVYAEVTRLLSPRGYVPQESGVGRG